MAEDNKTKFSLKYLIAGEGKKDWYKALGNGWRIAVIVILAILLFAGGMQVWNFFFPKKSGNVNNPHTVVLPFAKVDKVDQTSTQVLIEEKAWELSVGAGILNYDNKSGVAFGGVLKRKW
ncbi:MAG: hypothetical protein WC389_16755 [Lutibacter sp.]|jgi:hypothetical protein